MSTPGISNRPVSRVQQGKTVDLPRLAFRVGEAAEVLGVSPDFFAEHVAGELRWVRRGTVKLVSRAELERWLEAESRRVFGDE